MNCSCSKKEKKIEILNIAKKVFAYYGFKKTSMDDIATDVGLAKTSLYYYFKSKDQLFKEVTEHEINISLEKIKIEVNKQDKPQEKLKVYFMTKMQDFKDTINLYKVTTSVLKEILSYSEAIRMEFIGAEKEIILEILEEGINKGIFNIDNPELVTLILLATTRGVESNILDSEDQELLSDNYETLIDIFLSGIMKN